MSSPDAGGRGRAVEALEKIDSPPALAALGDAFQHSDRLVSARAVLARGTRGDTEAIPALVALIVDGSYDIEAADALGVLSAGGRSADGVVHAIIGGLENAPVALRQRLTAALAEIPGLAAEATLTAFVNDSDHDFRPVSAPLKTSCVGPQVEQYERQICPPARAVGPTFGAHHRTVMIAYSWPSGELLA